MPQCFYFFRTCRFAAETCRASLDVACCEPERASIAGTAVSSQLQLQQSSYVIEGIQFLDSMFRL